MTETIKEFFDKLRRVWQDHRWACLLAIAVGLVSIAPHFLAQRALGPSDAGFPLLFQSNEDYYLARVQEVIEGHGLINSPYLYEYKNDLSMIFPYGEYLYALPAWFLGVSAVSVLMAAKLIFPAWLFLLAYFLLWFLSDWTSGAKLTALFGGLLLTLGYHFVNYQDTWSVLTGQSSALYLSIWTRPVNPITGALFLLLFLIFFWKSALGDKWFYRAAAGVTLGLMTGYVFTWLVALGFLSAWLIISIARRQWVLVKKALLIMLWSLLTAAPSFYFWSRSFFASGNGADASSRNGLILTHSPIINKLVLAQTIFFLAIFFFEWYRKKKKAGGLEEWWWLALAMVAGNWLVYNQQILTGRIVWPPHLTQYTTIFVFLTFLIVMGNYLRLLVAKIWVIIIILGVGAIILFSAVTLGNYRVGLGELAALQGLDSYFSWLNEQAPQDCVVLGVGQGADKISRWTPAFTRCNSYSSPYFPPSVARERIYSNYLIDLRLRGIEKKDLEQYLWNHKADLRTYFYTDWSQAFAPTEADDSWLAGPIRELAVRYDSLLKEDLTTSLKRYRLDYLASEEELSPALVGQFTRAILLGKFGSVYVYQL